MSDGNGKPLDDAPVVAARIGIVLTTDGRVGLEVPPNLDAIAVYGLLAVAHDIYSQMRRDSRGPAEASRIVVPTLKLHG